jgi:hypothetical protein
MAGKVRRVNDSSVRVGSLGPLTVVRAGCELERSERSSSERSSDDVAIVVVQVTPAAASEVAA